MTWHDDIEREGEDRREGGGGEEERTGRGGGEGLNEYVKYLHEIEMSLVIDGEGIDWNLKNLYDQTWKEGGPG